MELDKIRQRIDDVDERICALLKERFDLVKEVAKAKKESGVQVENKDREREVIERIRAKMPDELKDYAEEVFVFSLKRARIYKESYEIRRHRKKLATHHFAEASQYARQFVVWRQRV